MMQKNHTPLHWASRNGHVKALNALLDRCADMEAKNELTLLVQTVSLYMWMHALLGASLWTRISHSYALN